MNEQIDFEWYVYIYIYIYICVCVCVYMFRHVYVSVFFNDILTLMVNAKAILLKEE